jgi:hypothetical protein
MKQTKPEPAYIVKGGVYVQDNPDFPILRWWATTPREIHLDMSGGSEWGDENRIEGVILTRDEARALRDVLTTWLAGGLSIQEERA